MNAPVGRCRNSSVLIALALLGLAACSSGSQSVIKDPDTASRLHVAEVAEASGQNDIALSMYRAAAEADPSNMQAQSRYAGALTRAGQFPIAEQVIARAIKQRPDDPVLIVALGRLKLQAGSPGEALMLFDKVLARDPANVGALIGRGVALDLSGQSGEAQRSYRAAQATDPASIAAANDLALSLLLTGRAAEARAILASLSQRPNAPLRVINNLAVAQAVAGDRPAALATLAGRISAEDLDIIQNGFGVPPPRSISSRPGPMASAQPLEGAQLVSSRSRQNRASN